MFTSKIRPTLYGVDESLAGAVLTIDLDAIIANWRTMNDLFGETGQAAAVVKADAYGLGAARVAPALAAAGCRTFFVALPQEAVTLRPLLPADAVLYALSSPADAFAAFATQGIRPVLSAPEQVEAWLAHAADKPYGLQVDTGMNRLGLSETEFAAVADRVKPSLLMSHLCCADEPDHPMTAHQLAHFQAYRAKMPTVTASLSASSGLLLGPEYRFDLGRPGIALYGGNPLPHRANPMRPVVRLDFKILQTHEIDTSGWVGYGATRAVTPGTRLATVAAGYADGILRSLSNKGFGRVGDVRVPIAGRVSMDLISFDVTAAPTDLTRPGQTISLLDPIHTIDEAASEAGTISYEILTSLSGRYHRRYLGGTGGSV